MKNHKKLYTAVIDVLDRSPKKRKTLVDAVCAVLCGEGVGGACEVGKLTELRTVVVPGVGDPEETVRQAATLAAGGDTRYKIIRYRPFGVREPYKTLLEPPTDAYLANLAELARSCGIRDVVIT